MAHVILAKRSSLTIISLQLLIVPKPFLRPVKLTFEPRLNWHGKKVVNVLLLSTKGSNHVQPIVLWSLPFIPHILTHILRSLTTAARNVFSACLSHTASNWWLNTLPCLSSRWHWILWQLGCLYIKYENDDRNIVRRN